MYKEKIKTSLLERKKSFLIAVVLAVILSILIACSSSSSVVGTWYSTDLTTGEESTLEFDSDNTGREGNTAFEWKAEGDTVTMTVGSYVVQATMTDGDTLVAGDSEDEDIYYRSQDKALAAYENAKQERIATASAEKEKYIKELSDELVGEWSCDVDYSDYTNEFTVTFNSDGTWSRKSFVYEEDYSKGSLDSDGLYSPDINEIMTEESGTWEITYDAASLKSQYASIEEECHASAFKIQFAEQNGSELSTLGVFGVDLDILPSCFSIETNEEAPMLNVKEYQKQ